VWGQALKPTFEKNFLPTTENLAKTPKNFTNHHQSEVCNFETAQHIDKQITDVSSMINVLKNGTKLGVITPRGFNAN